MRNILIFVLFAIALSACKKDDDVIIKLPIDISKIYGGWTLGNNSGYYIINQYKEQDYIVPPYDIGEGIKWPYAIFFNKDMTYNVWYVIDKQDGYTNIMNGEWTYTSADYPNDYKQFRIKGIEAPYTIISLTDKWFSFKSEPTLSSSEYSKEGSSWSGGSLYTFEYQRISNKNLYDYNSLLKLQEELVKK